MLSRILTGLVGSSLLLSSAAFAQQQPPPGGADGGPPSFAQMRQFMMERMKEQMGAGDDEWKVIEPQIEKVQQLQRQAGGAGPGMFGPGGPPPGGPAGPGPGGNPGGPGTDQGPGGPPPGGPDGAGGPPPGFGPGGGPSQDRSPDGAPPQPSEVQQKRSELREVLQNKDAAPADVQARLAALREARAKARADLAAARDQLRQVLSVRQEAVLVSFGILE